MYTIGLDSSSFGNPEITNVSESSPFKFKSSELSETLLQMYVNDSISDGLGSYEFLEASIDIEDYVKNFGSSLISRKPLHVNLVKPFQKKYGASDAAVERYVKLTNRTVKDIKNTIAYLNYKYKETLPTAEINDIAADMSLLFGQDIRPETIDSIIKGQGGEILFQTQGMKNRKQDPFSIRTREYLDFLRKPL